MDERRLGAGPIIDARPLAGGTQNLLLGFKRDGFGYVLRRLAPSSGDATLRRESRVLAALAGTNVPHPRLIAACDDEAVLGAAFYLMESVDGFNATTGLPPLHRGNPDIRRAMGFALVDGAATLGRVDPAAVGLADLGRPDGFLARQVERWLKQLEGYARYREWPGASELPGVERIARWLEANRPPAARPGLMHGDYHLANILFRHDGPALAAIVDWELTTLGDPLMDLGNILATWPDADGGRTVPFEVAPWSGFPSAADIIARYGERSSRDLSAITWYATLACFRLAILLEGSFARACSGLVARETGASLHLSSIRLLQRAETLAFV